MGFDFVKIKTIGDGSCFLHAVLGAASKDYKNSTDRQKKTMVKNLRNDLAELIDDTRKDDKTHYESINRGEMENLSKIFPELEIENVKKFLRSREWFDQKYIEYVSDLLEIDIYIIDYKTGAPYKTGDEEILHKSRNSVIIGYIRETHFETLGVFDGKKIKTFFVPDSKIIKNLKNQLYLKGKN